MSANRSSMLMRAVLFCALMATPAMAQWLPAYNLSGDQNRYESDPFVVVDDSGTAHVVYQRFLDSSCQVYYMYFQNGVWSARQQIGSTPGKGSIPCLAITPDGMLHAFYGKTLFYWRYKPLSGGSWSSPVQVNNTDGGFINDVAVDASGGIYFLWGHLFESSNPVRNGIYGRYKPLGGSWGSLEVIAGNSDDGNWPKGDDVFCNGNEIWVAINRDGKSYFKKRGAGGSWGSGYGTYFTDGGGLRFAKDPTSNEIAAGYGLDIGGGSGGAWWEAFVRYSYDNGATWTSPQNLSNATGLDRVSQLKYDDNGDLHYAWEGAGCDGCQLKIRYRARVDGVWSSTQSLSPSGSGNCGLNSPGAIATQGNEVHVVFGADMGGSNWWDVWHRGKVDIDPSLDYVIISHPLLIADNSTSHGVYMQATDYNGAADIKTLRWLINFQGDNSAYPRGYVAWGQTAEDIHTWDSAADWDIYPVTNGSGYWGIYKSGYGALDYINIYQVDESNSGNTRNVNFYFTVKPAYATDGPLDNNDISGFIDHAGGHLGWYNYNYNFRVAATNHGPATDSLTLNEPALIADNATPYTVTQTCSDGNGYEDVRAMRWLINYQGDNAGAYRGYVAWGLTPDDIGIWGGVSAWDIQPVASGEGYLGLRLTGWGVDNYITLLQADESHAGNARTVTYDFTVKEAFFNEGPLTDNDISSVVHDYFVDSGWQNMDLNFMIFSPNMPDFDGDTDVDQADFAWMQTCMTGQGNAPVPTGCEDADLDNDQDVDLYDAARLGLCQSGPEIPADGGCMNIPVDFMTPDWAFGPSPAASATGVLTSTELSWSAGTGATSHDVYFGTTNPPPFVGNQAGTTYDPGDLALNTTYFWRIDEVNSLGTTTGAVWSFATSANMVDNLNRYVLASIATSNFYYTDRTYTIIAMPASLDGNTGLRTLNDDRLINNQPEWVTFDLNVAADVYVAYDHRGAPVNGGQLPQWLSDNFTDSGLTITVSDGDASPFKLYKKTYSPGHVVLGSNFMPPADGAFSNYFVIFDPLP